MLEHGKRTYLVASMFFCNVMFFFLLFRLDTYMICFCCFLLSFILFLVRFVRLSFVGKFLFSSVYHFTLSCNGCLCTVFSIHSYHYISHTGFKIGDVLPCNVGT
uniref:Uncharacterized protein n=1 Tax=Cacopsylla melanoneura TaxID=428564 RepID=A0A8D8WFA9_9HEMI